MLSRTTRGAARALAHAEITFVRLSRKLMGFRPQAIALLKRSTFAVLAIHVATYPVAAHATEAGTFAADDEPSSITAKASTLSQVAFEPLQTTILSSIVVQPLTLSQVSTGESPADASARVAAETKAIEDAKIATAKKAADEAAAAAQAAVVAKQTVSAVVAPATVAAQPSEYDALFQKYFGDVWKIARAVCTAESGLNTRAVSPTSDYGLCQINQIHRKRVGGDLTRLFDPETNIRVASDIYRDNGGFHPWTVYKKGIYKKYLKD